MSKVYIFGPIYVSGESYLDVYKELRIISKKYFDIILCTYPDFWDSSEKPRVFYDRTYTEIITSTLFIAECSSPSHGVGMELQMAVQHDIPVIVLVKDDIDFDTSLMVLGIPTLCKLIRYNNIEDLLYKIELHLKTSLI